MNKSIDKAFASHLLTLTQDDNLKAFASANWCNLVLERSYYGVSQPHDAEVNRWVKNNIGMVIDFFQQSTRLGVKALGMKYGGLYGRVAVSELLTEMERTENAAIFLGCLQGLEGRCLSRVLESIEKSLDRKLSIEVDVFSKLLLFSWGAPQYRQELEATLQTETGISSRLNAKVAFALCRFGSLPGKEFLTCRMEDTKTVNSVAIEAMLQFGATESNWRTLLKSWLDRLGCQKS